MRKKENILIVCNTVYQIMVAVQIRYTFLQKENVHIIISDHMNNSSTIFENVRKSNFFNEVIYIKNRKRRLDQNCRFYFLKQFFYKAKETINNLKIIRKQINTKSNYNQLYVSNISIFTILLLFFLSRKKEIRLSIFEDGFATYCNSFKNSDKASLIHRLLNKKGMLGTAEQLFLFNPHLLEWDFEKKIIPIPKFSNKNDEVKNILNQIFQFENINDDYSKIKYLFLEESFFADGFNVNDVEIVQNLTQRINVNDVLVKLHPRNTINRFAPLGIKTNTNLEIPWELIILNQNISHITLITISSSSALTPFLIFDIPVKSISLLKMLPQKPGNMNGELGLFMQKIYNIYPDIFLSPETEEDFFKLLK